jgi:crossover junction endodeoxyribonuclease RuvC
LRILGVDPGLTRCGVGVIDARADRTVVLVDVLVIQTSPTLDLPLRLLELRTRLGAVIDEFAPDRVAVERVFAQHNLRTVMGTAQASGIALVEAAARNIPVDLHTPSEVKASITGTGRANKLQVASMVSRLLSLPEEKYLPDATDALALAICNAWRGSSSAALPQALTPAQRRWREAERQAKKSL